MSTTNDPNGFAALRSVRDCPALGSKDKLIVLVLLLYANRDGWAWPSVETIAKGAALHRRTVQRVLRDLSSRGIVNIKPSPGRTSSRYRINIEALNPGGVPGFNRGDTPSQPRHAVAPTVAGDAWNPGTVPPQGIEKSTRKNTGNSAQPSVVHTGSPSKAKPGTWDIDRAIREAEELGAA